MKTLFTMLATTTCMLSTPAFAENFNDTTASISLVGDNLDLAVDANKDTLTEVEAGFTRGNVRLSLGTDLAAEDNVAVRGEYNAEIALEQNTSIYGTAGVEYVSGADLSDGTWSFDPVVGASYSVSDIAAVYTELGYTWSITDDFDRVGGYVEVGVEIDINDTVSFIPSVIRTFDTTDNQTNVNLGTVIRF